MNFHRLWGALALSGAASLLSLSGCSANSDDNNAGAGTAGAGVAGSGHANAGSLNGGSGASGAPEGGAAEGGEAGSEAGGTGVEAGAGGEPEEGGAGGTSGGGTGGAAGKAGGNGGGGKGGGGSGGTSGSGGGGASGTSGTSGGGASGSGTSGGGSTGGGISGSGNGGASNGAGGSGSVFSSLVMEVTSSADPVVPDGRLLYTITVGNPTTHAIDGVSLLLRVPVGLQFGYAADAQPDSTYCGNSVCSPNEEAVWDLGAMAAGTTRTITVNAEVLQTVGDGDSIATSISLTATGLNPINVVKTAQVYSLPSAQLAIGSATDPLTPGQSFDLDLDLGQISATPLANAVLTAYLPSGLGVSAVSGNGSEVTPGKVVWNVGPVAVGAALHRTVRVTAASSLSAGQVLKARAELTYDGGLVLDNTAEYPLSVVAAAQPITIVLDSSVSPLVPDGRVLYRATVANSSARAIDGVSVLLRVPPAASFQYATDSDPDSSYCGNSVCSADEEVAWDLGTIAAGSSQTIDFNPEILSTVVGDGGLVVANLGVNATGLNQINLQKTLQVYSQPGAQLALGTQVDPVLPGQTFTYDLDLGQIGASALGNTTLRLTLPAGVTPGTISDGGSAANSEVSWSLGTVPVAGTLHRSVSVTVANSVAAGSILNARAWLAFDGGPEVDAVTDHAVSVVAAPLPLTISTTATPSPAKLGARLLYTTTITNTSARAVDGVSLLVRVPNGLSFVYSTDADPDSSYCGNSVCSGYEESVWDLDSLAAGAIKTITVNPAVAATLTAGSLITLNQRLTATGVATPINLRKTLPTSN